jgi:hypothetical protein
LHPLNRFNQGILLETAPLRKGKKGKMESAPASRRLSHLSLRTGEEFPQTRYFFVEILSPFYCNAQQHSVV